MERAWSILEELGAVDDVGRLTPLGRHMVWARARSLFSLADYRILVYATCRP